MRAERNNAPTSREAGFTLIELIVVAFIISVLMILAVNAFQSAKASSRLDAMQGASATIKSALDDFDRIYPRTPDQPDALVSRLGGRTITGNTGAPTSGLADETDEWLLRTWPDNPYAVGGVRLRVQGGTVGSEAACSTAGQPGDVIVCRLSGGGFAIVGYGRSADGATVATYRSRT